MTVAQRTRELAKERGIYLLPNLLTTAGLFAAFYSLVAASKGLYAQAALTIFVAMVADGLDGRVARLTKTQSDFGAQYDSISDMVAFGVAPAILAYSWALRHLGKFGWLAAFVYTATVGLRLARFNTRAGSADKKYFLGLPSPAAAACLTGLVWLCVDNGVDGETMAVVTMVLALVVAVLMVSHFRYYSFKELDMHGKVPFVMLMIVVIAFAGVTINPPLVLFVLFFGFALSGVLLTVWRRLKRTKKSAK